MGWNPTLGFDHGSRAWIFPELSTEQQDSVITAVRQLVGAEAVAA